MERDTIVGWSEVKDRFVRSVEKGEAWPKGPGENHTRRLARLHATPYDKSREADWEGGNGAYSLKVLRYGFKAPEFTQTAARVPTTARRRSSWNSQMGRPDATRLVCGDPNFFRKSAKRERKPGLRLKVQMSFSASVDASVIRSYGGWIAGLLRSLEGAGFDLTVDIWVPCKNAFVGCPQTTENVHLRVKQAGEKADFTEWSSLFGPTGFRHLVFTALGVAAEANDLDLTPGMGRPAHQRGWAVEYDKAAQTATIFCRGQADEVPVDALNEAAKTAGLI